MERNYSESRVFTAGHQLCMPGCQLWVGFKDPGLRNPFLPGGKTFHMKDQLISRIYISEFLVLQEQFASAQDFRLSLESG